MLMVKMAREIWLRAAVMDIDLVILHKGGKLLRWADALSRLSFDHSKKAVLSDLHGPRIRVPYHMFYI